MKRLLLLRRVVLSVAAALGAVLFLTAAASPDRPDRPVENRFLFIVDVSSAMRGYSNVVTQTVRDLLNSNIKNELRKNDTIGLWVYNDKLHTEFPMQVWSRESKDAIVADMTDFLADLPYVKRAHFDKVQAPLQQVIKNSEKLTVILISDGSGKIVGTPFDKDINELQKKYARELRTAKLPFVTALVSRNGRVFDYTINYPGLVVIPHTAEPEPVEVVVTNTPAPVQPKPHPRPKIEIILSGSANPVHTATVTAPTPTPVTVPAPPPVVAEAPKSHTSVEPPVIAAAPAPSPSVTATVPVIVMPTHATVSTPATPEPTATATNTAETEKPVSNAETLNTRRPAVLATPIAMPIPGKPTALYVAAFSLLVIAIVLVIFLVRRTRSHQSSLISQSIDRNR